MPPSWVSRSDEVLEKFVFAIAELVAPWYDSVSDFGGLLCLA